MSELEKLVNQIEKRKREKLESYKLNKKSEYDNLQKKERIISLIKDSYLSLIYIKISHT